MQRPSEVLVIPPPESARILEEGEIILIDKPLNWTSFDVVHAICRWFGVKKAGHAGTLDPRATGLLILCTGKQTKRIDQFANLDKEYTGSFELGIRTPSYDLETGVSERVDYAAISVGHLKSVVSSFVGPQMQVPPMFSAVKHHGRPLYKYARRGKSLERKPKKIDVTEFSVVSFRPPVVEFRVVCSKGTYIRSLVNDVGDKLGCGAVLTTLRRTRIGPYSIENALTIEDLERAKGEKGILRDLRDGHRIATQ